MIHTLPVADVASPLRSTTTVRRTRRPRRILMVAPTSFFADYGCHVRILEEARVLRRLGQAVTIVTYYTGRTVDDLDVRRTMPIPWRRDYAVGSSRHKLGFDALLSLTALRTALRTRPDVIHGHLHEGALIGGAVARLLRRPLVFDFQGSLSGEMVDHGFLDAGGRWYGPVRRLEGFLDRQADAIVTSSGQARQHLLADFGVDPRRLHALPDCVDSDRFRPGLLSDAERVAWRASLGVPSGHRVVVYLGLLARHQGTDLLLEAARRVVDSRPDTHFLVMGFPGMQVYYEHALAMGLGDHVSFTGRVPYDEAHRHLALGDVAVAPKLSTTEGSGKLLNYMAMGLPTVAFDLVVSREYLQEDGVLVPVGDVRAFADGILELLNNPAAAAARAGRLRRRAVEQYDWLPAGEQLLALYDRLTLARALEAPA